MQLFHPQPSENPIRVTQEATLAIHVDEMVADERILIQARDDHVSVELPHDAQGFRRRAVFDDGNEAFRIDQAAEMALEDEVPDRVLDAAGGDKGLDRRGPLRGGILRGIGPCALVHPRSSWDGVGARLDGWIPRTPSRGLAVGVVELGSGGGTSGAYIVSVVDHPYLTILLPLWLTMPSYPSTTPVVLTVRHAYVGKGCRPYLCQVGRTTAGAPHTCIRLASRVGSATLVGQLSEGTRTWRPGQHLSYHSPPRKDLLEVPD
ncbi:hypothetical protein B296_00047804 [Ensete ventricosum]|uniref:Uncharacterized protein n=1 Tax=Ensete ventricosum TaxID=4639 RepID=A0A426YCQ0_ENSVE|nr:hypothetical protein B296_00047804 [Ensete ventricosum]